MKKLVLSLLLWSNTLAFNALGREDPFKAMNYTEAFNPAVLKNFYEVLKADGVLDNIPEGIFSNSHTSAQINGKMTSVDLDEKRKEMIRAIQRQLYKEKRNTILRPIYELVANFPIDIICAFATFSFVPVESVGGGMSIMSLITNIKDMAKTSSKALFNYWCSGNDMLEQWEKEFAAKMPYISHKLWRQIRGKFGAVRLGWLQYPEAAIYFDIAFNLPTIHSHPYIPPLSTSEIGAKTEVIGKYIDKFFQDYENADDARLKLRGACRKYLTKLASNNKGFVCIHLEGSGGLGKTHFSEKLSKKISLALDTSFPVERITLRGKDPAELIGDVQKPGQALLSLTRVAKEKKSFGMVVFDEASWLNGLLTETAKKVFEPNLGSFNSEYLNGNEVSFKGFLLVFISNEPIKDEALSSRFIHVKFPSLKKANLVSMAYRSLPQYLIGTDLDADSIKQEQEILEVLEEAKTMRDIDLQFPIAIEKMLDRKRQALIGSAHEKTD